MFLYLAKKIPVSCEGCRDLLCYRGMLESDNLSEAELEIHPYLSGSALLMESASHTLEIEYIILRVGDVLCPEINLAEG